MMSYPFLRSALCLMAIASISACTKENNNSNSCSDNLYGYAAEKKKAISPVITTYKSNFAFGKVGLSSASVDGRHDFPGMGSVNSGAFNKADGCYYAFSQIPQQQTVHLRKINPGRRDESLMPANGTNSGTYDGVVYNKVNGKLYGVKRDNGHALLFEIVISGSTYAEQQLFSENTATEQSDRHPLCASVDEVNGNIYITETTTKSGYCRIGMYVPEARQMLYLRGGSEDVFGLTFSKREHVFYGMQRDTTKGPTTYSFVKMGLKGQLTKLKDIPFDVSRDAHSAVFDACRGTYILSSHSGTEWKKHILFQINTDGSNMRAVYTDYLFLGLAIR